MSIPLLLLAAVIAVVNGRTNLWNRAVYNQRVVEIASTTNCRFIIQVTYPLEEGAQPMCTSLCPEGEEAIWVDGVVFKKLAALEEFNLMVEMTYRSGTLQNCKLVPSQTAEEQLAAQKPNKCPQSCSQNEDTFQEEVEVIIPSVTELIPVQATASASTSSSTSSYMLTRQLQRFTRLGNSYYTTSSTKMSWEEAHQFCRRYEATLAFIETSGEQYHLKRVLDNDMWIGLNDKVAEGIFVNADNTRITYSNWKTGEPNNRFDKEDCVMVQGDEGSTWNDEKCSNKNFALCELPEVRDNRRYRCPGGFWLFRSSCYITSRTKDKYASGKNFCSARGAYPVFINSVSEHNFVAGKVSGLTFIGYTDSEKEGTFVSSSSGLPLYTRWKKGEPNNHWLRENCATMDARDNYFWNDKSCDEKAIMMCEKSAEVVN